MTEVINQMLVSISDRLERIDAKLGNVKDWGVRFGLLEDRITKLEETTALLAEIKERVEKIEIVISKNLLGNNK